MSKLDEHAAWIKTLYKVHKTAKATHKRLLEEGVEVSYEALRQWLHRHADELTALRVGRGKPAELRPKQLFGFLPEEADWTPGHETAPAIFYSLIQDTPPDYKDVLLDACLTRYGVQSSLKELDATHLPLKQLRNLCDLEIYLLAYLLGDYRPLVGVSLNEFWTQIRAITPMAVRLRQLIACRNSVTVGELRKLLHG